MKWRFLTLIGFLFLSACGGEPQQTQSLSPAAIQNVMAMQADYFPMAVGSVWTYEVKINQTGYTYNELEWPVGDGSQALVSAATGFLYPSADKTYLTLKISEKSATQGPFSYPDGVRLEVSTDDAQVYRDTNELFYNVSHEPSGVIEVQQVATYNPSLNGAPPQSFGDGYSIRTAFFSVDSDVLQDALVNPGDSQPRVSVSLNQSQESLSFLGFDSKVPGYDGKPAMHFLREIKQKEAEYSFTEDLWFIQDVGLVKLVQKSGETQSMTWDLVPPTLPPA